MVRSVEVDGRASVCSEADASADASSCTARTSAESERMSSSGGEGCGGCEGEGVVGPSGGRGARERAATVRATASRRETSGR